MWAAVLTFVSLFIVINGFIVLVWWALSLPPPPAALPPLAGPAAAPAATDVTPPLNGLQWTTQGTYLLILGALVSWGLFKWVFSNIARIVLDVEKLPDGRPSHRKSGRHYHPEDKLTR